MNTSTQSGINQTAIMVTSGHKPCLPVNYLNYDKTKTIKDVREFIDKHINLIKQARDSLVIQQDKMSSNANKNRREFNIDINDYVMVSSKHLQSDYDYNR